MKSVTLIDNFEGKKVLVRVDWDVPLEGDTVKEASRIEASLETIRWVTKRNGKAIILSHIGHKEPLSLRPAFEEFSKIMPAEFTEDPFSNMPDSQIVVVENIRRWPGEIENDPEFCKKLASLGEIYVNEGFPVAHRKHTSVIGLPRLLPGYAGVNFQKEVEHLSKAFHPEHPFLVILSGAKLETKLPLLEKFTELADDIFVGGLLAQEAVKTSLASNHKILFPIGDVGALDINQETVDLIKSKAEKAKFILWNGPVGQFETGHDWGTKEVAKILAETDAEVIVGGGDTVAAIKDLNIGDKFTWLSTAGGAMLDFLATGTLPGIQALEIS